MKEVNIAVGLDMTPGRRRRRKKTVRYSQRCAGDSLLDVTNHLIGLLHPASQPPPATAAPQHKPWGRAGEEDVY